MNNKSVGTQDKTGSTPVDLKKLYSSHVLENTTLQHKKSDLESAKQKKLRELNNSTSAFLRKYDKYASVQTASRQRQRRASVDVGLARALELRYQNSRPSTSCTSRKDNVVKSKSFARDSINSDCPYSLDSWNVLVDSDTDIIEQFKREILNGCDSTTEAQRSRSAEELHADEGETMNPLKDSRLLKRRTLKPLTVDTSIGHEENALNAEIMEIQNGGKPVARGRRHSVIGVSRNMSLGTGMKLPSIESGLRNTDKKKSSSLEKLSKVSSVEDLRPLKVNKRRRNTTTDALMSERSFMSLQSPVPEVNTPDLENVERPVANAAIFIRDDSKSANSTDFNCNGTSLGEQSDIFGMSDVLKTPRSDDSNMSMNFLPAISTARTTGSTNDPPMESVSSKRVQFMDDDKLVNTLEPANVGTKSPQKYRAKHTLTTATLKLLVDSHHGAAKLRYIALLANEMEKEEAAKHTPRNSPEPNPYEQLSNCRYLRVHPRQDSFVDSC